MAKKTRKTAKKKKISRKTAAKKKKKTGIKKRVATSKKTASKKKTTTKKKTSPRRKATAKKKAVKKPAIARRRSLGKTPPPTKKNQVFPGYPQYPSSEDIMNKSNMVERIDTDLDKTNRSGRGVVSSTGKTKVVEKAKKEAEAGSIKEDKEKIKFIKGNDADVSKEDIEALGPKDLSMDMGDDEQLRKRKVPADFSGKDLDVPGSEDDDDMEEIGSEDEENNPYSLGGERHEDEDDNAGVRRDKG